MRLLLAACFAVGLGEIAYAQVHMSHEELERTRVPLSRTCTGWTPRRQT